MNELYPKDQANICKTCTCGDRLKAEGVLFWFVHNSFHMLMLISQQQQYSAKKNFLSV